MVTSSPSRTFDCYKSPSVGMSTMTQIQEAISRLLANEKSALAAWLQSHEEPVLSESEETALLARLDKAAAELESGKGVPSNASARKSVDGLENNLRSTVASNNRFGESGKNRTFFKRLDLLPSKLPRLVATMEALHDLRLDSRRFVRLPLHRLNGANGMSDIEGKVTRAGASEGGQRRSCNIVCCNCCKGLFLKAGGELIGIREWSEWDERH